MTRASIVFSVGAELVVVGLLLWKHEELYNLGEPFLALLAFAALVPGQWAALKRERLPVAIRRRLVFLTGPLVLLSLSLITHLGVELRRVAIVGGMTKEMSIAAKREGVLPGCDRQWAKDNTNRIKSEFILDVM
jgi:hypothetical protein